MSLVDVTSDKFKSRLRPFGISFEKSLSDLIKGIRSNNGDKQRLSQFFNNSIQECRKELKSNDMELKSMAILKLTYLEMYGFDLPFMNFQILEVMSSLKFQHKRIGYLAAIQILARENNDDVLMLMTNLLKKDLNSSNHVEVGLAISCLSSIVTRELAQDVIDDLMKMFSHSKPFIRKKAILASYKVFLKYPESLKLNYERLVDKLDDSEDISVVSATVNVICELAKKQPANYIELTPKFFALLTSSSNNWMIIRLLKLFSSLSLVEPRIKKKLLPAVVDLMSNTKASSLMYECINCILAGNMLSSNDKRVSELMVEKLLSFVITKDQNLKYVSILAFIKIINIQPELIKKHQVLVLEWLKDEDLTIRSKSLQLVDGLIDKSNLMSVVSSLLIQVANDETLPSKYKLMVSQKILSICGSKNFSLIPNFDWYLATLKDLLHLMKSDSMIMLDISNQFSYLGLRVPSIRAALVDTSFELIMDETLPLNTWWNNCVWCISEYLDEYLEEQEDEEELKSEIESVIKFLIGESTYKPLISTEFSDSILPIFISSLFKTFVKYINIESHDFEVWNFEYYTNIISSTSNIIQWMENLQYSFNIEVQERSIGSVELLKILRESLTNNLTLLSQNNEPTLPPPLFLTQALPQLYNSYDLKPIALGLQQRLDIPPILLIEEVINEAAFNTLIKVEQLESLSEDETYFTEDDELEPHSDGEIHNEHLIDLEIDEVEAVTRRKKERLEELKDDPYYISSELETLPVVPHAKADEENSITKKLKKKKKHHQKLDITILEEEDIVGTNRRELTPLATIPSPHSQTVGRLKFKMDDSQLLGFDLKADASSINGESAGEYEVEKLRQELLKSSVKDSIDQEKEKKKKTKKKKKKKKAEGEYVAELDNAVEKNEEDLMEGDNTKKKKKKSIKKRKALIN